MSLVLRQILHHQVHREPKFAEGFGDAGFGKTVRLHFDDDVSADRRDVAVKLGGAAANGVFFGRVNQARGELWNVRAD